MITSACPALYKLVQASNQALISGPESLQFHRIYSSLGLKYCLFHVTVQKNRVGR